MDLPKRKKNRLASYDYSSAGAYFITICAKDRKNIFCRIVGDGFPVPIEMPTIMLTETGKTVKKFVENIPEKYGCAEVDKYVIMPNHIHMIISITSGTGNPSPTVGSVIGWFKYQTTKQINAQRGSAGEKIWQRSFHDHIIRDEHDYEQIWQYIDTNSLKWEQDCFYCE